MTVQAPQKRLKEVKKYIQGLDYNLKELVSLPPVEAVVPSEKKTSKKTEDGVIICERTHQSFSSNISGGTVIAPILDVVWPGSLVFLDERLASGVPAPVRLKRAKEMNIFLDLPSLPGNGNVLVKNPSPRECFLSIGKAVDEWVKIAAEKKLKNKSLSSIAISTSYNSLQASLSLGFNLENASTSIKSSLSASSNSESKVTIAMFRQVYFSAYFNVSPDMENIFPEDLSLEDVKSSVSNKNPPGYVSQVDFGRIAFIKMESSSVVSDVDAQAALSMSTSGEKMSVDMKAKYDSIIKNSVINVVTIGGDAVANSKLIASPSIEGLREIIEGYENSVIQGSSQALPISYYVKALKDSELASITCSGDFWSISCKKHKEGWVAFANNGGYVAYFSISWTDENGGFNEVKSGDVTLGWSHKYSIPGTATDVRVEGYAYTGLFWQPTNQIFSESFSGAPNKTWDCRGTTLNAYYSH